MINVFKKIWSFSVKEKNNLQKSMVIGFVNAMFNALLVTALYIVLKAIVENTVSVTTAWTAFGVMVLSIVGKIVTQYYSQLQRAHAGYFMVADKRMHIGEKLKSVPMGYFNQNSLGKITAIETTILNDVESAVPVVLVTTLGGFLNSLVFAIFILFFDWRMGAITLFGIFLFLWVTSAMEKKSKEGVPARQDAQAILVETVLETIQGMSVVKAFDLDNTLDKKVDKAIDDSFRKNEKLEKAMTPYVALQQLVLNVFSVVLMFCAIAFYLNGSMELTNSLIMVICSFLVYEQLKVAGSCVANMRIAEYSIGEVNVKDYTLNSLMRNVSMVFQNVYLFADTIENNIKFGKSDATFEEVVEAAKRACCHDFILSLPDGYQTKIGEGGSSLSGEKKQRISIARALIKDAEIVIFDEATANVDPENEDRLQTAMEELTKDKTVIMIAHRLKTVRNAEKILVLNDGKIVQEGRHDKLIKETGIYADFVNGRREAIGWKLGK